MCILRKLASKEKYHKQLRRLVRKQSSSASSLEVSGGSSGLGSIGARIRARRRQRQMRRQKITQKMVEEKHYEPERGKLSSKCVCVSKIEMETEESEPTTTLGTPTTMHSDAASKEKW